MERRRLQQQRMKQQQRCCVSQQDLTQALTRMKPQRRATHDYLMHFSSSSSLATCSIETLTVPSVSQLIKEFEARTVSTPYVSAQDFAPNKQLSRDQEQNDHCKLDLPPSPLSSYHSAESGNNIVDMSARNARFSEIRAKEAQLNNALADLISISNDADISSSMSSSSRSLLNHSQRRRASSTNENTNSISTSIALLNNLLETFDLDLEKMLKETTNKNETVQPINMFW